MKKRYAVGIIYLLVIVATLVLRISGSEGIYDAVTIPSDYYFTLIVQLLCFGVLPLYLYSLFVKRPKKCTIKGLTRDFGYKKLRFRDLASSFVIGICMIYAATVVSFVWNAVLSKTGYTSVSSQVEYTSLGVLFLELLMTAVLPATFEELTHRGLLFAGYRDSGWKVVLVSALLFSLMHQNIRQTGYTFFDGLVLALLVYYSGSIFPAMLVHFMNNAVSVLWDYGEYTGGWLSFMGKASDWFYGSLAGYLVGVVLFVLSLVLMLWLFYRMRNRAVDRGELPEKFPSPAAEEAIPLYKDGFLWTVIAVGIAATAFSFVWGIMR